MMDRILSLIILLFLSPLILVLLTITFFVFRCNPVFIQERTVSGECNFTFIKIRSMVKYAPNIPTGEFKHADNYITPWGKFLRTWSLDEILNLLCILRGDMKFIGPRPIMLSETELLQRRKDAKINNKPGITGLAQINGRDKITQTRKVACERYYCSHSKSVKLKLYIIIQTFYVVVSKKGIVH